MHIEKIKIKNFKCFKEKFELILNENVNIIVGENEAGKSTIIEAINLTLSGWFKGRYIHNELNEYIFNKETIKEYILSLLTETPLAPPSIKIEIFLSADAPSLFKGDQNSERTDSIGLSFNIEFDEKYLPEYKILIQTESIKSLPIEYYNFYWESFARDERITPRLIPIKPALIDSSNGRLQNGSDIYISRIIKDFLDQKEIVDVSQAHRKMKDVFMQQDSIININRKIQTDSNISNKKVELSVELSSKNSWENSLVTYLDEIPFHHIGKGEQCIIKTKLALSHKKTLESNVLLIEEPENHLSHTKLNELIHDLKKGAEDKQIIVTTHSSFIANKLGLDSIILLNAQKTITFKDLEDETFTYFKRLAGYDTLRLILSNKSILVEGDSDELIIQKAYSEKHDGKLPIEDGIDVISVGTSFLRFLQIAEKINKPVTVITDTDWSLEQLESKYKDYIGENKKPNILISYDSVMDDGDFTISGKPYNYNTLEPKLLKANSIEKFNLIFNKEYTTVDEFHKYMKSHKTECALKIFDTEETIIFPHFISDVI
jgi:putative ATP-dependent endonuclease of OLD family